MLRTQASVKFGGGRVRHTAIVVEGLNEAAVNYLKSIKPQVSAFVRRRVIDAQVAESGVALVNIRFSDSARREELSMTLQSVQVNEAS